MVGGQLHHEGSGLAGKGLGLLHNNAGKDDGGNAHEVAGGADPPGVREQGAGDEGDNGQLGAAGHKGGGHNAHLTVGFVFHGTGGHDAGDAAAGSHQHGDEVLTGQAEAAEDPVHNEGDTGHVAAVLQNGQEEEQQQHLGHEAQHSAHAGDNTIQDKSGQQLIAVDGLQSVCDDGVKAGDVHGAVIGRIRLLHLGGGLEVLHGDGDGVRHFHLFQIVDVHIHGQAAVGRDLSGQSLQVGLFLIKRIAGSGSGVQIAVGMGHVACVKVVVVSAVDDLIRLFKLALGVVIGGAADAEEEPSVLAQQLIVGPVRPPCAHGSDHD